MDEFVSTFTNRLDQKGRVSIPAPFRAVLAVDGFDGLYCCPTLDRQAIERAESFDIMHCHVDYVAFPVAALSPTPTVHTLHGRLDPPHLRPVFAQFRELPFVSISNAQRAPLDGLGINWAATVYHGLPLDEYPFGPDGGEGLVYLARMSPEKLSLFAESARAGESVSE